MIKLKSFPQVYSVCTLAMIRAVLIEQQIYTKA